MTYEGGDCNSSVSLDDDGANSRANSNPNSGKTITTDSLASIDPVSESMPKLLAELCVRMDRTPDPYSDGFCDYETSSGIGTVVTPRTIKKCLLRVSELGVRVTPVTILHVMIPM